MKKKLIGAIGALIGVAVLAVATVLLINAQNALPEPTGSDGVMIISRDEDELKSVKIDMNGASHEVLWRNNADGTRTPYLYLSATTLSSTAVSELTTYTTYLRANRIVEENAENLMQYGLEEPRCVVTVTYTDGTGVKINVGNLTPNKAGCYFTVDDGSTVYTMFSSVADVYTRLPEDYRQMPSFNIDPNTVTAIAVQQGEDRRCSMALLSNIYGTATWEIIEPFNHNADSDAFQTYLQTILAVKPTKFIAESPDDLAPYGLELIENYVSVIWTDPETKKTTTVTAFIGDVMEENSSMRYIMFSDAKVVYAVPTSQLAFMENDIFSLMEKYAFRYNIKYLEQMTIYEGERVLDYVIERTEKLDENGEVIKNETTGEIEYDEKFFLNGEAKDDEQSRAFYATYLKMMMDGKYDEKVGYGKELLRVKFRVNAGEEKERELTFCEYNKDYYAVLINGTPAFVLKQAKVRAAIEDNQKYVDGTLPSLKEQAGYDK